MLRQVERCLLVAADRHAGDLPQILATAMIDAAPADRQRAIATTLFAELQLGELLALPRQGVDLPGQRLNVRATLTEVNGCTPRLRWQEPTSRAG